MNIVGGYCEGIARAHGLYQAEHGSTNCVVVLVESAWEDNFNYFDQQIILNALEQEQAYRIAMTTSPVSHEMCFSKKAWKCADHF